MKRLLMALGACLVMVSCQRSPSSSDEEEFKAPAIQGAARSDSPRLKQIEERIEQLKTHIYCLEDMSNRYILNEDFYQQNRTLADIKGSREELSDLEKEKAKLSQGATGSEK